MTRGRGWPCAIEAGREMNARKKKSRKEIGLGLITIVYEAIPLDAGNGLRVSMVGV